MRRFQQVDVFSPRLLRGNPMAVVVDSEGLTTEQMRTFTRWTNLSEATFLSPPTDSTADYRVRIFTAAGELPFAGHPTLGNCHAWSRAGGRPRRAERIVQECGAGLIAIRQAARRALRVRGSAAAALGARLTGRPRAYRSHPWSRRRRHRRQSLGGQRTRLGRGHA